MKKPTIILTVAALVLSVVSLMLYVQRAGDENPDFGLVREVYTYPTPTELELIGEDAELFCAYDYGAHIGTKNYGRDIKFESVDPTREFTLGTIVTNGESCEIVPYGELYKQNGGAWEYVMDISSVHDLSVPLVLSPDSHNPLSRTFSVELPVWETGRYRAMFTLREYFEGVGSGEEEYEAGFEFEVPAATSKPFEVIEVQLSPPNEKSPDLAWVAMVIRSNNGTELHAVEDSLRLERRVFAGIYESVKLPDGASAFFADDGNRWYDTLLGDAPVYGVYAIVLRGWNSTDDYRLSLDFAENTDGSGERYTLTLTLKFGAN